MPAAPVGGVRSPQQSGLHPLSIYPHPVPGRDFRCSRPQSLAAGAARRCKPACVRLQPSSAQPSLQRRDQQRRGAQLIARGFGDDLLDFINAGPKMRKWYGEGERLPRDGGADLEDDSMNGAMPEEEAPVVRDSVLVTDADGPMGELVVLKLILAREKVRVLVKDAASAKAAYGPYVAPVAGDAGDPRAVAAALRGARAAIVTGRLGGLLPAAQQAGLEHLVVLSTAGGAEVSGFSLGAFMGGDDAALRGPAREAAVAESGVPHTIVRAGAIRNGPGGGSALSVSPVADSSSGSPGAINREDLASVLVGALSMRPQGSLTVQVAESGEGSLPSDWAEVFAPLAAR